MSDQFVGEIRVVGFNFAPIGWALCNGQLMAISQNTALFALLGTTYGGDGRSTFGLPDFRESVPMSSGQGPGLSDRFIGEMDGVSTVTLTTAQLPAHTHPLALAAASAETGVAADNLTLGVANTNTYTDAAALAPLADNAGGGQPHNNRQPYLALNFVIALQGIFPARN
jgi:microcystin-dependent protein